MEKYFGCAIIVLLILLIIEWFRNRRYPFFRNTGFHFRKRGNDIQDKRSFGLSEQYLQILINFETLEFLLL